MLLMLVILFKYRIPTKVKHNLMIKFLSDQSKVTKDGSERIPHGLEEMAPILM